MESFVMLNLLAALAATAVLQAAPSAPVAPSAGADRMLKDVPGVTVKYYDVTGKNGKAIEKSIAAQRPKGTDGKPVSAGFTWNVNASINKRTEGTTCTVVGAKIQFVGNAELPRLVTPQALDAGTLQSWNSYVANLDKSAALELGYYADHMPDLEKALTGKSCDAASGALDAAMARLKTDEAAFVSAYMAAHAAPAAQPSKRQQNAKPTIELRPAQDLPPKPSNY